MCDFLGAFVFQGEPQTGQRHRQCMLTLDEILGEVPDDSERDDDRGAATTTWTTGQHGRTTATDTRPMQFQHSNVSALIPLEVQHEHATSTTCT